MRRRDPLSDLLHLVGEHGFRTKDDLGSFCLSVGLFQGKRKDDGTDPPKSWDPTNYETWPMVQIITYAMDPSIEDLQQMKRSLYPYFKAGIDMVTGKIVDRTGMEVFKEIAKLIPP